MIFVAKAKGTSANVLSSVLAEYAQTHNIVLKKTIVPTINTKTNNSNTLIVTH